MFALSGYISCIFLRSIEKIEGQGSRGHPFSFEISFCCYRIVRTMKSIFIDDKWVSRPPLSEFPGSVPELISTRTDPQPRPQGAFPWGLGWNDPVKSFDSEWCWVLKQRIYRVDVLSLKNLFVKQNLCSSILCAIIINLTQHDQVTWVQVVDHLRSVLAIHTRYCTFLSSENKGV